MTQVWHQNRFLQHPACHGLVAGIAQDLDCDIAMERSVMCEEYLGLSAGAEQTHHHFVGVFNVSCSGGGLGHGAAREREVRE